MSRINHQDAKIIAMLQQQLRDVEERQRELEEKRQGILNVLALARSKKLVVPLRFAVIEGGSCKAKPRIDEHHTVSYLGSDVQVSPQPLQLA